MAFALRSFFLLGGESLVRLPLNPVFGISYWTELIIWDINNQIMSPQMNEKTAATTARGGTEEEQPMAGKSINFPLIIKNTETISLAYVTFIKRMLIWLLPPTQPQQ